MLWYLLVMVKCEFTCKNVCRLCLRDLAKLIISSGFPFFVHPYTVYIFAFVYIYVLPSSRWCLHFTFCFFLHLSDAWFGKYQFFTTLRRHDYISVNVQVGLYYELMCAFWCAHVQFTYLHFLTFFSGSGWWSIEEDRLYSVTYIDQ